MVVREAKRKGLAIIQVHFSAFISVLLAFPSTGESRIWALRLSLQALIAPSGRQGATEEIRTVAVALPSVEQILLDGEIGRVGVRSGRDARRVGQKVAYVGGEGRRG